MTTDDLLAYLFEGKAQFLAAHVGDWMASSKRFRAFLEEYRDKIRKKLRGMRDEEGFRDLEAELATAYLLLRERRFTLTYEQYGGSRQRGADFSVLFKGNLPFNVEVKRLRSIGPSRPPELTRYLDALCDKVGQFSPAMINLLLIAVDPAAFNRSDLAAAMLNLRVRIERKDNVFFVHRGFRDARDFLRYERRLGAVLLYAFDPEWRLSDVFLWPNPFAEHPLPRELNTIFRHWNQPAFP
ncbi:MAG: hypothetical protein H0X37_23035 [Herpetosiphonaceae bacterium]|nr:hypothetical protein [Herpetosiphonaceae bacterium]